MSAAAGYPRDGLVSGEVPTSSRRPRQRLLDTPFLAIGTHAEIAEHLLACRSRWGICYFSVRDIKPFAPVIEHLKKGLHTEP